MGLFDPIDWNGDGKHDFIDDMLEFAIYQECTKYENDSYDDDFDSDEEDW